MLLKIRVYQLLLTGLLLFVSLMSKGQDIPLFSQKLTNSFMYNPAIAGENFGSVTLTHRSSYLGVNNAPQNNFLSAHTPFFDHRFGTGINVYQEKVNFINNLYLTGAFAYHLSFSEYTILSMGVSAEYTNIRFDVNGDFKGNAEDIMLAEPISELDFSYGMNFQHRYFKLGGSINRLATRFALSNDSLPPLSEYFSGYVAGLIPVRGGLDILEPTIYLRRFTNEESLDLGLYYTYNDLFLFGASYRKGLGTGFSNNEEIDAELTTPAVFNFTTGIKIQENVLVGYSYEMFGSDLRSAVGSTHEITLRYDFNERSYQDRFRRDYKNSMNFRRKTLSGTSARKKIGSKSPRKFNKRKKKQIQQMSPSKRYQNIKKLGKRSKKKFDVKKRQKKNYKRRQKQRRYRGESGIARFFRMLFGGGKKR